MKAEVRAAFDEQVRLLEASMDLLLADVRAHMPARVKRPDPDAPERTRLLVPKMPHEFGLSCEWHCLPDSIDRECLIHSGYRPAS